MTHHVDPMFSKSFTCAKHDAFGLGTGSCALCDAERDPLVLLCADGVAAGRRGSLSDAMLDAERWRDITRVAQAVGFSGVVPSTWQAAWLEGYREAIFERHRSIFQRST